MYVKNYGELRLSQTTPEQPTHDPKTGCFLPGVTPHNKGKKWDDYISPEGQLNSKKGWSNLAKRPNKRPDNIMRSSKAVVAIDDNGKRMCFISAIEAERKTHSNSRNIGRCCRSNAQPNRKRDYKCNGLRWFFLHDLAWLEVV